MGLGSAEHPRGPRGRKAEMDKTCLPRVWVQEPADGLTRGLGCAAYQTCNPGRPWAVGASASLSVEWGVPGSWHAGRTPAGGTGRWQRAGLLALFPRRSCWWQNFPRGGTALRLEELAAVPSGREDAGGGGLSRRRCEASAAQRQGDVWSGPGLPPFHPHGVWRCPCLPGSRGPAVWGGGLACFRGDLQCLGSPPPGACEGGGCGRSACCWLRALLHALTQQERRLEPHAGLPGAAQLACTQPGRVPCQAGVNICKALSSSPAAGSGPASCLVRGPRALLSHPRTLGWGLRWVSVSPSAAQEKRLQAWLGDLRAGSPLPTPASPSVSASHQMAVSHT